MQRPSGKNIFVFAAIVLGLIILIFFGKNFLFPESLDEHGFYYKNVFGVYTNNGKTGGGLIAGLPTKVEGADHHEFSIVHIETDSYDSPLYAYAISDNKIFFNEVEVEGVDIDSFEYIGGGYAKDEEIIFFKDMMVENVDYDSFEHLGESVAVDNVGFYYRSYPVLKEKGQETYILFNPNASKVLTNKAGSIFIQDLSGSYKLDEIISVRNMNGEYHQAKRSDMDAITVIKTKNMTVYSTHVLY